jgi:hypothetical protein
VIQLAFAIYIYRTKKETLGVKTSPLNRESLVFTNTGAYRHYYEPKPGMQIVSLDYKNTNGPSSPMYYINSDTLNQGYELSVVKPKGVYRIASVGDSFTFGKNVNTSDNYPLRLNSILKKSCKNEHFEVLNFGVYGYDISYSVERFEKRAAKYDPDLVIWLITTDDFQTINDPLMDRVEEIRADLSGEDAGSIITEKQYADLWVKAWEDLSQELGEDYIAAIQENLLVNFIDKLNKPVVFLTSPHLLNRYQTFLRGLRDDHTNVYIQENLPGFKNENRLPDNHINPEGNYLIAQSVFDFLLSNNIVPCD